MAAKHLVSELRLHVSVSLVCTYLGTPSYLGCLLQSIRIQAERARRCEGWVEWGGGGQIETNTSKTQAEKVTHLVDLCLRQTKQDQANLG